jgi:hypothetical protein
MAWSAAAAVALVEHNAGEPRTETGLAAEGRQAAPGVEKCVLDSVFSALVLADHAQRDREFLVLMATDEFLEGGLVALAGEADQN